MLCTYMNRGQIDVVEMHIYTRPILFMLFKRPVHLTFPFKDDRRDTD